MSFMLPPPPPPGQQGQFGPQGPQGGFQGQPGFQWQQGQPGQQGFPGSQWPGSQGPIGPGPQGPQGSPPPAAPPPPFIPQQPQASLYAVDPGAISGCLFRNTYVWLNGGESFWFFPTFVGRTSAAGFRWNGRFWLYFGIDLRRIQTFTCF